MPAKSKAQLGKLFVLEREGKLESGTARRWARHTPNIKSLPEHVGEEKKATLATGRVGNTTSMLNPVPAIPAPTANPLQSGIRQAVPGVSQPNAAPQAAQPVQPTPPAPLGQWAAGMNGSPVYPPGQGPVSGQVPKSASLGSLALALYIAKGM